LGDDLVKKLFLLPLLCAAMPVQAQEYPVVPGDYITVSMISVEDGHDLEYANHLAGMWRKGQDFAVKQGWITGYEIQTNENKRPGEPDFFLVTRFAKFADPAQEDMREKAYTEFMKSTAAQMQAASSERAKYRTLMGTMLLRAWKWRN